MNAILPIRTRGPKVFTDPAKAYRAGRWCQAIAGDQKAAQWCRENGIPVTKTQTEGTATEGGFAVPDELLDKIISLRETYGALRAAGDVRRMGSDVATVPRRRTAATAYWTAEGGAITASQIGFGAINLLAQKLAVLVNVSSELDEDSAVDLGELFVDEMAYSAAVLEDDCAFNGTGTAAFNGIVGVCPQILDGSHNASKVTATAGHDLFSEIGATDLASLIAKCPSYAISNSRWFISQLGFALVFCRLANVAGGIVSQVVNSRNVLSFMGFPIQITQALPQVATTLAGAVMLAFGDLSLCATLGERRGMTLARSTDNKFAEDLVVYKGIERVAINVHDLGDNTTAGPIVGLVGG